MLARTRRRIAVRIGRPVWRDRGLVADHIGRGQVEAVRPRLDVAMKIPQPEVRTDALLKVAEIQARRGDPNGATQTYRLAAEAVASIPLDDPRAILAGVLLDNMIAVGRFDDAKASIGLYDDRPQQIVALGAIAESQGRRGRADEAPRLDRPQDPAPVSIDPLPPRQHRDHLGHREFPHKRPLEPGTLNRMSRSPGRCPMRRSLALRGSSS